MITVVCAEFQVFVTQGVLIYVSMKHVTMCACVCGCVKQSISWARGDQVEKACVLSAPYPLTLTEFTDLQRKLLGVGKHEAWGQEANLQGFHLHGPMGKT